MSRRPDSRVATHYKSAQSKVAAQASSQRFTAKQSQFSRKEEERQVLQNIGGGSADISRFEQARRRFSSTTPAVAAFAAKKKENLFALHEHHGADAGAGFPFKRGREDDAKNAATAPGPTGMLLGLPAAKPDDDQDDEGPSKKSRFEKFQEVIHNSRSARIRQQRDRTDREKETDNLDVEFDAVAHLLQKRDKRQEQIDAFAVSGTPEVRALLKQFRENRTGGAKIVSLTESGGLRVVSDGHQQAEAGNNNSGTKQAKGKTAALDADDKKLLAKLTSGKSVTLGEKKPVSPTVPVGVVGAPEAIRIRSNDDDDDFDKLLNTMRQETRRAQAGDRTLSPEEEQRLEERQLQLQEQRSVIPTVKGDDPQLTRREWLIQGGDAAHQMDDDDDVADGDMLDLDYDAAASSSDDDGDGDAEGGDAAADGEKKDSPVNGLHPLDVALAKLEELCTTAAVEKKHKKIEVDDDQREYLSKAIASTIDAIHLLCKKHSVHAAQSFRLLLVDMERRSVKGLLPTPYSMLLLLAASRIFPTSDFRHPVVTPLLIYLSSTLMQLQINTPAQWKVAVVLTSILLGCMRGAGNKFCSEILLVPLNLLALQVPRKVLEPVQHRGVRMPCPLLVRPEDAVPPPPGDQVGTPAPRPITILSKDDPTITQVLLSAIGLFHGAALLYCNNPAFDYAIRDPLARVCALIDVKYIHPSVKQQLEELQKRVMTLSDEAKIGRTPLAMRSFRPRPIRLFDPMLVEALDPTVKEHKELKKELREDRKRVVRHVLAEATVERRAREKETAAVDAHRERKYKQLVGELQAQEHVMKTVDSFMLKARSKKRKGVSGDPYKQQEGGAAEGAAGGDK